MNKTKVLFRICYFEPKNEPNRVLELFNHWEAGFLLILKAAVDYIVKRVMNDRLKTDFLCPSSSFLSGFGSVLNVRGSHYHYNTSEDPDEIAIAHDWNMVGQDLDDALENARNNWYSVKR